MLGIVLAPYGQVPNSFPYGIGYSYGGDGTFMCPYDPYYNQRGETGFYHDTQLGTPVPSMGLFQRLATKWKRKKQLGSSIPGDLELQSTYGYAPHMSGWVTSKEGFVQTPWNPPNGWRPTPLNGLSGCSSCAGPQLRDIPTSADINPEVARVLQAMNEHNQKVFTLSLVTTFVVAVSGIVAIIRNTQALKQAH